MRDSWATARIEGTQGCHMFMPAPGNAHGGKADSLRRHRVPCQATTAVAGRASSSKTKQKHSWTRPT